MTVNTQGNPLSSDLLKKTLFQSIADTVQQHTWLVGFVVAGIYGIGWFVQYVVAFRLGVGPIYPSRESSFATGLTFFLFILPILFERSNATPSTTSLDWKQRFGKFAHISLIYFGFLWIVIQFTLQKSAIGSDPWLVWKAIFFLLVINLAIVVWTSAIVEHKDPMGVYQLLSLLTIYTASIAPFLQPVFGGYSLSKVAVVTATKETSGVWLLVTTDAQAVTLAKSKDTESFWKDFIKGGANTPVVIRVSLSEVKLIKSIPENASTTK